MHALLAVLVLALALCPSLAAASQEAAPAAAAKPAAQEPAPAPEAKPAPQEPAPAPAVKPAAPEAASEPAGLKVILLKPSMRFEDLRTEAILPAQAAEEAEYEHHLLNAARKAVGSKGTVLEMDKLEPPAAEACKQLHALASRLARGNVNEEAMEGLGRLAALDERYAVLVQFFRLKTGPGRSWNPNTGAITSSMASTLMQAALVSCKTGKVIWKGEQLIRNKALKPTNANFHKALAPLYQDFDIK
jgi:pyruvate/2-oxoglutarate dehydrogenase complex dihydrolipoamide acyltransferase (E2) component